MYEFMYEFISTVNSLAYDFFLLYEFICFMNSNMNFGVPRFQVQFSFE